MSFETIVDTECDASTVAGLSPDQHQRVARLLDEYLIALENGNAPDPEELIADNPDIAEHLEKFLLSINFLQTAAGGFSASAIDSELLQDEDAQSSDEQRLGDFQLVCEIGRGGMATVFEARQISLNRRVALKVLPFAAVIDSRQITRFRNEASVLATLQHPNIVPVYAIGEQSGIHYYAMRLIEGRSLDQVLDLLCKRDGIRELEAPETEHAAGHAGQTESQPQPDSDWDLTVHFPQDSTSYYRTVARIGMDTANAIQVAHETGIVHRDIKPSNLLIDGTGAVSVTDFGLARWHSDRALTRTGDVIGTLRYMSPEQARGDSAVIDHRSDIYSLGITLYELTTLRPAYDQEEGPALLRQIESADPMPPRRCRPQIPVDLESIVLKAISPERDDRYATAGELAEDLRRFIHGESTIARQPTILDRMVKWSRRHRRTMAAMMAIAVVMLISSVVSTLLVYREKMVTEVALDESERNYRQAREVVDRFGTQLAEKLAAIPGAERVRRDLMLETLDYYQEFVRQSDSRTQVRSDIATTLNRVAILTEQIGTVDEALAAHSRARDVYAQLIQDEPDEPLHRKGLALCENNLGLTLAGHGESEQAVVHYSNAIQIQQKLVEEQSLTVQVQLDLALSFNNRGLMFRDLERYSDASEDFQQARATLEDFTGTGNENATARRYHGAVLNNLASLPSRVLPEVPSAYADLSLQILRSLVRDFPDQMELKAELAGALNNRGASLSDNGIHRPAAEMLQEAISLQQDLATLSPLSHAHRRELAVSLNNLGMTLAKGGDAAAAEQAFQRAAELQQALHDAFPGRLDDASRLGSIQNNLGMVLEGMSRFSDAAGSYDSAVRTLQLVFERSEHTAVFRDTLSRSLFNSARVYRRLGDTDRSIILTCQRRQLWKDNPDRLLSVAEEIASNYETDESTDRSLALIAETIVMAGRRGLKKSSVEKSPVLKRLLTHSVISRSLREFE